MMNSGLMAEPKKVEVVFKMERPTVVAAVQRFITKHLSKFLQVPIRTVQAIVVFDTQEYRVDFDPQTGIRFWKD